jgi:DNA-binding IclR family transcriptional regulator
MSDDEALMAVSRQGIAPTQPGAGGNAPGSARDLLARLAEARARGYAVAIDSYLAGMAAMAVPVRRPASGEVIGCLSIAAPSVRLDAARMAELAPPLQTAAEEIGAASRGSRFFSAPTRDRRMAAQ